MGLFILVIMAVIACVATSIYEYGLKKELKEEKRMHQYYIRNTMSLEKEIESLKKEKDMFYKEWLSTSEKRSELADTNKRYRDTIYELKEENYKLKKEMRQLKNDIRQLENDDRDFRDNIKEDLLEELEEENKRLKQIIIKATKERIEKKVTTITEKTIKRNNWQTINHHGFSVNRMYTAIPNGRMARSSEYNQWIASALCEMKYKEMPSLARIGVNPNKPMKLEVEFKLVKGSDTDNPLKAFIDLLVRYYKLNDDNNFVDIHVTRNPIWANTRSEGNIKFRVSNI